MGIRWDCCGSEDKDHTPAKCEVQIAEDKANVRAIIFLVIVVALVYFLA